MERLDLVPRGCVGKCAKEWRSRYIAESVQLVTEGFLAVVISDLSDAPSQVVQKFNTVVVDGSRGFSYNRDEEICLYQ